MKRRLLLIAALYITLTVIFLIAKGLFIAVNHSLYASATVVDIIDVMWHGLPMDFCVAGYFTLLPALVIAGSALARSVRSLRLWSVGVRSLLLLSAFIISIGVSADTMLYPYWGFKLDTTPLFYFLSSPASAVASGGIAGGVALFIGLVILNSVILLWPVSIIKTDIITEAKRRWLTFGGIIMCTAILALPIRGGIGVSTMNLSRSYFSPDTRLNHAAVNPLFSLLYSATHQQNFGGMFRYFDDKQAAAILAEVKTKASAAADSVPGRVSALRDGVTRPDVYIVILESFSSHIIPSLGGENVAVRVDSVASTGWSWTECYASSFRTDRALPAILSGYPGQPTTSIMKFASKAEHLPSLPGELKNAGYRLSYYYGGDINFTGMNTYLVSAGFEDIISDKDFSISDRLSKWGVPDHILFTRHLADMENGYDGSPSFTVIQTSSSHEPFDVPYTSGHTDKRLNAFAYTDHHTGVWLEKMKQRPEWDNTLIILVADHYAVWPDTLTDQRARHHIPLILTGGAIDNGPRQITAPVSQTDIAATLLGMLGLDKDKFEFSNDLLDASAPRMAFFTDTEHATLLTPRGHATLDLTSGRADATDSLHLHGVKAYLQTIYTDLQNR